MTALRDQLFDFSYLPSASCYFLRGAPYRGEVSALTSITRKPSQSSLLIVQKSNPRHKLERAARQAPRLYQHLLHHQLLRAVDPARRAGISLTEFFVTFPVAAFQGQIDAVIAGSIDVTMVYEDAWLATPGNAEHTKVIARLDDLPTPPIIMRNGLSDELVSKLKSTLLAMRPTSGPGVLYSGFTEYNDRLMQVFYSDLAKLPGAAHAA